LSGALWVLIYPSGLDITRMGAKVSILMDVSRPYTAICPTLDGEVLVALAGTTRPLTGRGVARLLERGESHKGVLNVLARLVDHGLVHREEAGNALLYTLNRDHLAFPAVEILAGMRSELIVRLRRAIGEWEIAPEHASLFGSAARGDGNTESDIDLFIVRPAEIGDDDPRWRSQLNSLASDVEHWCGNHASLVEVSTDDLDRLASEQPPVVADLMSDGIVLVGAEPASLFSAPV
jgi:predicted nucleotidyltransferase